MNPMRVPYMVGRFVKGETHYGRERVIEHLLHAPDNALWLVGTRRVGKTSMLRHLEVLTVAPDSRFVPVYWSFEGQETARNLSDELVFALEEVAHRFTPFGIDVNDFAGADALIVLRRIAMALTPHGRQLLILIDEAEVLIHIAAREPAWVARLRRALMDDQVRTVMASTKFLSQLNVVSSNWVTSPLLFGFSVVHLGRLDDASSRALVRQTQGERQVLAHDSVVDDVLIHTAGQPYLIQYLCNRLFTVDAAGRGRLRAIQDADLNADMILVGLFQNDYQNLSRTERRVLLAVADLDVAKEGEVLAVLSDLPPLRIRTLLRGLASLGYLRQVFGQWAVGNEFLRRWILVNAESLKTKLDSNVDEQQGELLYEAGQDDQARYLRWEIARLEESLASQEQARPVASPDRRDAMLRQMDRTRRELKRLRDDLAELEPGEQG
jgi:hypothetical protein